VQFGTEIDRNCKCILCVKCESATAHMTIMCSCEAVSEEFSMQLRNMLLSGKFCHK
jgi:hypothetical protein